MFISLGGLLRFFQKSTAGFSFLLSVFFFFVRPVSHRLLTLGLTPRPIAGLDLLIFLLAACCSLRAASPAAFFLLGRIASPLTAASFQPCIWSKTGISFCQRIIFLFFYFWQRRKRKALDDKYGQLHQPQRPRFSATYSLDEHFQLIKYLYLHTTSSLCVTTHQHGESEEPCPHLQSISFLFSYYTCSGLRG